MFPMTDLMKSLMMTWMTDSVLKTFVMLSSWMSLTKTLGRLSAVWPELDPAEMKVKREYYNCKLDHLARKCFDK